MSMTLKALLIALRVYYANAEECEKIIITWSAVSAAACAAGSVIPGPVAVAALIGGCFISVWKMYVDLSLKLGLRLDENILKVIASGVIANLTANLVSLFVMELILVFIPGISIGAGAMISFSTTFLAGKMFLFLILTFAQKGKPLESCTKTDYDEVIRDATPTREDLREAKTEAKKNQAAAK